ncbi:hypothetical protein K438DRAFT_2129926 [Mycena galopus ATCC 62051]|nr:hypothetical protein K438DRAFT_2129926 [Mycena galopus ATCC 62051]
MPVGIFRADELHRGHMRVGPTLIQGLRVDIRVRKEYAPARVRDLKEYTPLGVHLTPLLAGAIPLAPFTHGIRNGAIRRALTLALCLDPAHPRIVQSLHSRLACVLLPLTNRGVAPCIQGVPLPLVERILLNVGSPGCERMLPVRPNGAVPEPSPARAPLHTTPARRASSSSSPPPVVESVATEVSHETPSLLLRLKDSKRETSAEVKDAHPRLLSRLSVMGQEGWNEGGDPSLFQRLGVPLEQRLGNVKPRHHGKHNRTQKRLKKEGEEFSRKTGEGIQRWEDERCQHYAAGRLHVLEQQREYR